jgi:hypothetical protein
MMSRADFRRAPRDWEVVGRVRDLVITHPDIETLGAPLRFVSTSLSTSNVLIAPLLLDMVEPPHQINTKPLHQCEHYAFPF